MDDRLIDKDSTGDDATHVINILNRLGLLVAHPLTINETVVNAIRTFQQNRGLDVTGAVNSVTMRALEEAQWKLGDRSLYLQQPPLLRGDDIATLQSRLTEMGFDCGRVDGVFG